MKPGVHQPPAAFGCWSLRAPGSRAAPFETQLDQLLSLIEAFPVALAAWCAQHELTAWISVGSRFGASQVGFAVERQFIRRLATLDLAIDFDLYPHGWLVPLRPHRFRG